AYLPSSQRSLALSPEEAAQQLYAALASTQLRHIHLCPLEWADGPKFTFGNCRVGQFSIDELRDLAEADRIARVHPEVAVDWAKLAKFDWLIVEEVRAESLPPA